ncbi:hypothetical protein [Pseudomarimonas salicorniae]|uniref:Planctomycete cytochrome C n=1 Tax=Pseudomarimonas salicorniae TaxID=2933270 RepID=A0ABT0GJ96_9GAMM|nr:hypothetical protein [Lysobacter sp. CAU 1642]MCK7594610.1 hypothetical protein [Lysobacter sp. CAU 1642]
MTVFPRHLLLAAALGLTALPALSQVGSECDDLRGEPIAFAVDWQTEVKPILVSRCINCHGPGQRPDVSDQNVDAIYKLIDTYVRPGQPLQSRLFDKINCNLPGDGRSRMPLAGQPLPAFEQGLIFDWIKQGARGEPGPPIDREGLFSDGLESRRFY